MPKGVYQRQPRVLKLYDPAMVERVRELYAAGNTQTEIGEAVGVTQRVIWKLMVRHGIAARVAAKRNQTGDNNSSWRGESAGKQAFHRRLYALFGKPTKCSVCETEKSNHYDYANLTGHYEDINDYAPMCRSCHWKYDDKVSNITKNRRDADAQGS